MSSTPPRNSDFSFAPVCSARSKLSSVGSNALTASDTAYSRKSCCSRAVRLRAFSNSACRRASRSIRVSRSTLSFCNSPPSAAAREDEDSFDSSPSALSDAGNSCVASRSWGSTSDFPFVLAIKISARVLLLPFLQALVKHTINIIDYGHGMLIVDARRSNHRKRSHDFTPYAGGSTNQHKVAHRRQRLVESYHYADCFLLGVQIRTQQPDNFLFLLQSLQQFLQALSILLSCNQIGCAFNVNRLCVIVRRQRTLLIELLDRSHQAVVFAALLLQPSSQLAPHRFHGPAAKALVDEASRPIQISLRDVETQNPVSHHPRPRHHHGQHFLIAQPGKINVLQRVLRSANRYRDPNIPRNEREHVRGALHELLHVRNAMKRLLNNILIVIRQPCLSGKLLDVITIGIGAGHTARRSVRLLQVARVRQIRHHIADGRRAQSFPVGARQSARSHRFACGNKGLHNRGQDFAFALAYGWSRRHTLPCITLNRRGQPASTLLVAKLCRCNSYTAGCKMASVNSRKPSEPLSST